MELERTIKWTTKSGKEVSAKIKIEHGVKDTVWNADGIKITTGRELADRLYITLHQGPKFIHDSYHAPELIDDQEMIAKGVCAVFPHSRIYINQESYDLITSTIELMEQIISENQTDEYRALVANEKAKKEAREAYEASDAYREEQEMIEALERLERAMDDPDSDY